MSKFDDYKRILGLKDDFTEKDLKKAYFKLAKKYHPDKNKSSDTTEKFKEINNAYSYLKDYIAGNSPEEESYQEETYNYQQEYSTSQEYNEPNSDNFDDFAYKYDYQYPNNQPSGKIVLIIFLFIIIFMLAFFPSRDSDNTYNEQADTTQSQVSDYDTNYFDETEQPVNETEYVPEYTNNPDNPDNSSTEGTDFGPYMKELERRIKMNWDTPKYSESTHVVVLFKIAKDGRLMNVEIKQSSGYSDVDQAAINAVKLTAPFRPLPADFKADHIDIQFNFDYNVSNNKNASYEQERIQQYEPEIQSTAEQPAKPKNTVKRESTKPKLSIYKTVTNAGIISEPKLYNSDPYIADLLSQIERNWKPAESRDNYKVVITVRIAEDGSLLSADFREYAKSLSANSSAMDAIENAAPFEPLPRKIYKYMDINISFNYEVTKY